MKNLTIEERLKNEKDFQYAIYWFYYAKLMLCTDNYNAR